MSLNEFLPAIRPVLADFDSLGIRYYIGGSVASSFYGEPRSTLGVDLGADINESVVKELVSRWDSEFYVIETAVAEAVGPSACFNLIHLATSLKVDIFVCGTDAFNASVLERRIKRTIIVGNESQAIWLASPEDVLLHKLVWYRKGNEVSDRQWRDILGIMKQQNEKLDSSYLGVWAKRLKVADLFERINNETNK